MNLIDGKIQRNLKMIIKNRFKVAAGDSDNVNTFDPTEQQHNDIVYLQLTESTAKDLRYILSQPQTMDHLHHNKHKADYQESVKLILKNLNDIIKDEAEHGTL